MATAQPTLLYVDDNPDDLVLMQLAVAQSRARFDLQMASGYYEAVDYLAAQGKFAYAFKHPKPVLVLIDYCLGSYNGGELTQWVRERPALAGMCVVILTQSKNLEDMAACYVAGADCYLTKCGTFEGLIETVRALDECLGHHPPRLEVLRELAMPADLMQKALRKEMREGLAENRRLLEELRQRAT